MNRTQIREIFLRNGFNIKPGCDDLKSYVYEAAEELLSLAEVERLSTAQGEPVAYLRRDQLQQIKTRGPVVGCISPSPRVDMVAVYTAPQPAVQGEPVGEVRLELGSSSYIFAELYSKSLSVLTPGTKLYTAPQPAADVAELVEALQRAVNCLEISGLYSSEAAIRGRATLAAYRNRGES